MPTVEQPDCSPCCIVSNTKHDAVPLQGTMLHAVTHLQIFERVRSAAMQSSTNSTAPCLQLLNTQRSYFSLVLPTRRASKLSITSFSVCAPGKRLLLYNVSMHLSQWCVRLAHEDTHQFDCLILQRDLTLPHLFKFPLISTTFHFQWWRRINPGR